MTEAPTAPDNPAAADGPGESARPAGLRLHLFAVLVAVVGGALGILGALFQEVQSLNLLLPFIGAPLIEEALKPAGIYILLVRWPHALRSHLHTAVLAALAGLCFGIIESLVYVTIYVDDPSDAFITFRFTVTLALHAAASFLLGLGLDRRLIDWSAGRAGFPKRTRNLYAAGVALHAAYNTLALILAVTGVLDFD